VRAFWYAGSREGAEDVEVKTSVFDPGNGRWSEERSVATPEGTQRGVRRLVRKLGNPSAARGGDGRLWLFYVTVSVGGWAGSSITAAVSDDEGETWSRPRRLVTSPFFNVSTLVRGAPFLYDDGTMGLPVYHEFIAQLGELLRLDQTGSVIDKQRLGPGGSGFQPVVLLESPTEAVTLLRRSAWEHTRRVLETQTADGGRHWSPPVWTTLANPDAAISGLALGDGRLLVALNNIEEGRDALALVLSADRGKTWRLVQVLEDQLAARGQAPDEGRFLKTIEALERASDPGLPDPGLCALAVKRAMYWDGSYHFEFSYPHLIQTRSGQFHLVYDWNRTFIKHVRFNSAWLEDRIGASLPAPVH
jgi:predicted neuraminidase